MIDINSFEIKIEKEDDNIIFISSLIKDGENITFNLNSVIEIFDCEALISGSTNKIHYNEDEGVFALSIDSINESIIITKEEMLVILYDMYYYNKSIKSNNIISDQLLEIKNRLVLEKLSNNDKLKNMLIYLKNRIDIFYEDEMIATGKAIILETTFSSTNVLSTGIVGELHEGMNVEIIIHLKDRRLNIKNINIDRLKSSSGFKTISLYATHLEITITNEEGLCLVNTDLHIENCTEEHGTSSLHEDVLKSNTLDEISKYCIDNKNILIQSTDNNKSLISDDFFDDFI